MSLSEIYGEQVSAYVGERFAYRADITRPRGSLLVFIS
jgi:hypothetical protein